MPAMDTISQAVRDSFTVQRVFGDAIEKDGLTVIPVAAVSGGGGGGEGSSQEGGPAESGSGSGFGGSARPVGVYVVRADGVEWQPALDVTRLGVMGMALAALLVLAVRSVLRHR